jgi:MFS family permease
MFRPRVRDAVAVRGLFLTTGFAIAAFFPFLALYLRDFHGLDESQLGLVLAFTAAARMVMNPVWGHLADTKIGRLTALQIGLAGSGAAAVNR